MWWSPVIIGAIAVVIAFIGGVVFSAAANRRAWKDNLEDAYSEYTPRQVAKILRRSKRIELRKRGDARDGRQISENK